MFNPFKKDKPTVKLEETKLFLIGKFQNEIDSTNNRIIPQIREMESDFSAMKTVITELQSKSVSQQYANIVKNRFCNTALEAIDGIDFTKQPKDVVTTSFSALRSVGGINLKEFKHLHAFHDDMSKIAEKTREIEKTISQATKIISDSPVPKIDQINSLIDEINEMENSIKDLDEKIEEENNVIKNLSSALETEEEKIGEMKSRMTAAASDNMALRDLERAMESIKNRIEMEFSGLDKIFKKYAYFGDLSKEQTSALKEYIKGAGSAFMGDEKNIIKDILFALDNFKDKKMLGIDEGRREKIRDLLRHFEFLVDMRHSYGDTEKKAKKLAEEKEKEQEPLKTEIKLVIKNIESFKKEMPQKEERRKELEEEKRFLSKTVTDRRIKIELMLAENLGLNITLV